MEAKHLDAELYATPTGQIFAKDQLDVVATVHQHGANMESRVQTLATADRMARAYNAHDDLVRAAQEADMTISWLISTDVSLDARRELIKRRARVCAALAKAGVA